MSSRVALVVAGCLVCPSMPMAAEVQSPAGVSAIGLTFDDEFDKFVSSPNGNAGWMTAYPYEGEAARALPAPLSANKEAQFYSNSSVGINPFSVHDGVFHISAARHGLRPIWLALYVRHNHYLKIVFADIRIL